MFRSARPSAAAVDHDKPRKEPGPPPPVHLSDIAFGLLDAHVSGVDFFDTEGGQEVLGLVRLHRTHRPAEAARS